MTAFKFNDEKKLNRNHFKRLFLYQKTLKQVRNVSFMNHFH